MPILDSVRNMLTRRRPEEHDDLAATITTDPPVNVAGTQAEKLFEALHASEQVRRSTSSDPDADLRRPERATAMIESKPSRKAQPIAGATLESSDVVSLVKRIGEHLDEQSASADQMITLLEKFPDALSALPELNRQSTRLIEIAAEAQQHAQTRDGVMNKTLNRIGDATEKHTEVLGLLQQQLDSNGQTSQRMNVTLDSFQQVLSEMSASSAKSVEVLSKMAKASERREFRISTTLAKSQKWMIAAMIFCGAVSALALGVAVLMMINIVG